MLETETYINGKFFLKSNQYGNDVLKAIKERRSIRRFKADQITDEELKTFGGWHLGCNRTWHPETIYRCRTEHGNMRPTAQDER